jgi:hypothetical protein
MRNAHVAPRPRITLDERNVPVGRGPRNQQILSVEIRHAGVANSDTARVLPRGCGWRGSCSLEALMMTTTTIRTLTCLALTLSLAACADLPEVGVAGSALSTPEEEALYYGINPPRHAEKATTVGPSGAIVAQVTATGPARLSIRDRDGEVLHIVEVHAPGWIDVDGLEPGAEVYIRPETIGTMVKLLTPEQIAGANDEPE